MKILICLLLFLCLLPILGCAAQPTVPTAPPTVQTTAETEAETTQETVIPDKVIALTLDDGPNNDLMPKFLDTLAEHNVKATFFLIGNRVSDCAQVVKRAYDEGHEIGNHSFSHIDLAQLSKDEFLKEVELCQLAVEKVTGERPAFFRPPFLSTNSVMDGSMEIPYASGYVTGDGVAGSIAADRYYRAVTQAHDGAIILMHCASHAGETLKALPQVITELRAQGYEFVTVSELFARKGITPEIGVMYKSLAKSE